MKFADLTPEQKYKMYQSYQQGNLKSPEDIDKFYSDMEPSILSKALDLRDRAGTAILDKVLPEKKLSDLAPSEVQDLEAQKKINGTRSWEQADKFLADRVGEKPINLLENPRFIAHPEIARGLNSLASFANIMSPTNDIARAFGMPSGPRLSEYSPTAARMVGDLSVRDAASLAGDVGLAGGLSAASKAAKNSKPILSDLPTKPIPEPRPMPPFASPEVQNVADAVARKDALSLQQLASQALLETLGSLKEKGLSNASTASKVVNSYDLPISKESTEALMQAFPDHPEVQKLRSAMERTATGEARTKGNYVAPSEDFVVDKGERTPITTVPDADPVIGKPHPGATLDYTQDPRFKTHFQEGMQQTEFPFDPLVGEAAYSTMEPLDHNAPILGREGEQKLYTESHHIGKPDQLWHTPETEAAYGGAQKNFGIENNPDFYKLLQLTNNHAKYAPNGIEPLAMEARNARMGRVADELRETLKGIKSPLPENLSEEDLANFARAGGEGTTGERVQNVRNDTTKRMGLQEDLAPIARGDKELALVNRAKGVNDTRAMAQDLAQNYGLPQLLEQSNLMSDAEDFLKSQKQYLDEHYAVNSRNKAAKAKYEEKLAKISSENAKLLADFGARKFGIMPSKQDVYNLSTRSLFSPMGAAVGHLAVEKAGRAAGYGIQKGLQYMPEGVAEELKGPWNRASLIGNVLAPREDQK